MLLIGADITGKLMTGRRKQLKCGAVAFETLLGWTLIGKTNVQSSQKKDATLLTVSMFAQEANVADLWELDTLGIVDPIKKKTKEEYQAEIMENFGQRRQFKKKGWCGHGSHPRPRRRHRQRCPGPRQCHHPIAVSKKDNIFI